MPSMLGLTTDPSPHGPQASQGQQQQWQDQDNSNYGKQLAKQATRSMNKNMKDGRHLELMENDPDKKKKAEKGWKTPSRQMAKKPREGKPTIPDDKDAGNPDAQKLNTIKSRNAASVVEMETLIWRALCDRPKSASKYMGKDAVVSNWLIFDDTEPRSKDSEPTLQESLEKCEPYLSYKMGASQVAELGLMAVVIVYEVTLFKQSGKPMKDGSIKFETDEATVSSTWRQVASGDWELASMMVG